MSLSSPCRHALPVTGSRFHNELCVSHAGWEMISPGEPYPHPDVPFFGFDWREGRTLPEFCLTLLTSGSGELQTRDHHIPLAAGDAFLVRPGEWHRHRPSPGTGWTSMWIHYHGDEPARWLKEGLCRVNRSVAVIEDQMLFQAQFERLIETVDRSPSTNSENLSLQAFGLLSHLVSNDFEVPSGNTDETSDPWVNRAVDYIWNFSHQGINVSAVARELGIARRTLDRRFMAAGRGTVLEEIQRCRITRAARLLRETTMPVKQIVLRAGFRTAEQLRLAFHQAYGASPASYRKEHRRSPGA